MDVSTFHAHRRSVDTPAGEIAYTEFGSGPAALFVHGIGTSGLLWRHVIEEMQDTTRCIAIDLPPHGGTPARDDMSVAALAQVVADLGDALGLAQVDLVGNDTGGAVAQVYAARHPDQIRSLTLTNCDCEGTFPPEGFLPFVELARQGQLAPAFTALAEHPEAGATGPLAVGYEHPERVAEEVWRAYLAPGADLERARAFERLIAAIDAADLDAVSRPLRALSAPTMLVWGTGDETFPLKWAYHLRDMIPGAKEVVEVDGAKLFFPEERPGDLVSHLSRHWGR